MGQTWFYGRICSAHIEPDHKDSDQADNGVHPVHQEHDENLNRSSSQRCPTVAEARVPVLSLGMNVRPGSGRNRFILTHTFSSCSICTIESVAKDNVVRAKGRVAGRGSRNIIRCRWCRHCLVMHPLREQLVQIVWLFCGSPVPTRLV